MQKAIALLRVSGAAQAGADREGLPVQRELCQQTAERHGLEIVQWVELKGVSGAAVLDDPRFVAMLDRLQEPEISGVIVREFSRLMRPENLEDYKILEAFRKTGALLYSPTETLDLRNFSDRLVSVIRGQIEAEEREKIRERTSAARERKRRMRGIRAEGGGKIGMPRGVAFDPKTEQWSYVFPEADKVREAFRLFLSGVHNFSEIGRRTGIGGDGKSWAVHSVLRQPLYTGVYRVDRRWVKGRAVPRSEGESYEHQVIDPPLVSRDDFDRAQKILAERAAHRPRRKSHDEKPGVYGGFTECGVCGSAIYVQTDAKGYAGYICGNRPHKKCNASQISTRLADPQIDTALERMLGSPEMLERLLDAAREGGERRAASQAGETQRKLAELENRRVRVKDAYEAGVYDVRELQKKVGNLDGEISVLRGLMERETVDLELDPAIQRQVIDIFSEWGFCTRDQKRRLLRDFQIRMRITVPVRRVVAVEGVEIGVLCSAFMYKKMKRLSVE